jgi:hypothetical protein
MYKPGTLKDSNIISALYSLFSGVITEIQCKENNCVQVLSLNI